MENKTRATIIGFLAVIAPLYFLKTVYVVWFGSPEILVGFRAERTTWLVLGCVDFVGFLATLPAREKGRVIQVVMFLWTVEMYMVYLATVVR